mmetsp:Transcript_62433/g.111234  ORF Transcript_62433/g.111234 Transcript_62433/m.111234 type:complete len:316 (+) Transcript_62433:131-1078(+)
MGKAVLWAAFNDSLGPLCFLVCPTLLAGRPILPLGARGPLGKALPILPDCKLLLTFKSGLVLGIAKVLVDKLAVVSNSVSVESAPSGGVVGVKVETWPVTGVGIEVAAGLGDCCSGVQSDSGNAGCLVDVVCICGAVGAIEGEPTEGCECAEEGPLSGPPLCFGPFSAPPLCFARRLHPKTPAAPNTAGVLVVSAGTMPGFCGRPCPQIAAAIDSFRGRAASASLLHVSASAGGGSGSTRFGSSGSSSSAWTAKTKSISPTVCFCLASCTIACSACSLFRLLASCLVMSSFSCCCLTICNFCVCTLIRTANCWAS